METTTTMTESTLNSLHDLIEINLDSADGFRKAADNVQNPLVTRLFKEIAAERAAFAAKLKTCVRINDETPSDEGSWKAKVHRWWMDLRSNLSDDDLKVVLEEAERGEDRIKVAYEEALTENPGNPVSDLLHEQYARIKTVHDRIRDARDRLKAAC